MIIAARNYRKKPMATENLRVTWAPQLSDAVVSNPHRRAISGAYLWSTTNIMLRLPPKMVRSKRSQLFEQQHAFVKIHDLIVVFACDCYRVKVAAKKLMSVVICSKQQFGIALPSKSSCTSSRTASTSQSHANTEEQHVWCLHLICIA